MDGPLHDSGRIQGQSCSQPKDCARNGGQKRRVVWLVWLVLAAGGTHSKWEGVHRHVLEGGVTATMTPQAKAAGEAA